MSYTPTDKYIPCPFNGLIKEKYSKSYKFSISKPTTYPLVEDTVNGVVWIEDLELMDNSNIPDDRNTASNAAGRDTVTDPTGNTYFSLKNNFYVVAQLYSFPQKNAKNGSDLYDPWNDINSRDGVRYLEFSSSKGFRVQEGELDKNSTADDLINLALKYLTFSYKSIVYGIKQYPQYIEAQKKFGAKEISLKEFEKVYDDIASLPENKMSLVIENGLVVEKEVIAIAPTQSVVPIKEPSTMIFNVERINIFSSKELGDLKVITDISEKTDDFIQNDITEPLDPEYGEESFEGSNEESVKVDYTPDESDVQSPVTETTTLDGPLEIPVPKQGELTISAKGLAKLKKHEGSRSTVYDDKTGKSISSWDDCKGFPTVGVGHLIPAGEKSIFSKYLSPGKMSDNEIDNLLIKDLQSRIKSLNKKLTVKVSQNQFDSLLSMMFNTGGGNKSLLRAIHLTNEGKKKEASDQIRSGPKTSKGVVLKGLERRRDDEADTYIV